MSAETLEAPAASASVPVRIRPFTPEDYTAIAEVGNTVFPDYADTPDEIKHWDTKREPHIKWGRYVAEDENGRIIATGDYYQPTDMYHPRKFQLGVTVLPEYQGKGIGKALYNTITDTLAPFDPLILRAHAREDFPRSVAFLTRRGYAEEMREWESRLDMQAWDPSPWQEAKTKATEQGIVVKSLKELFASDPDAKRKLYELDWTITLDMPSPDTLTQPSYEHFENAVLNAPNFLPEGWFVALDGDKWVGESALWLSQAMPDLYVGATGVRREYRRRGIATALKIYACEYAKQRGVPQIKTWNAQINRAMLSINEALGFVKQPAWISYGLKLKDEEGEAAN
jgi:GNAT superfamily N-acetyltransferase